MACKNSLEEEYVVIWNTVLPHEGEPRTSPAFRWMGAEWCFRFVQRNVWELYHVISLHRMSEGKISEEGEKLEEPFRVKAYMMPLKGNEGDKIDVRNYTVDTTRKFIWYCEKKEKLEIFEKLQCMYGCPEVKFACRFYSPPSSSFKLQIGTESTEAPSDLECLSGDLGSLLEGEHFPDVRLRCGGRTFPAHRSVLAARSEVFAAMFRSPMSESLTGGVDVQVSDPDVLRQFLRYLYTGRLTEESEDLVASLFAIADQYAVHSLKGACTRRVVSGLTEGNCVRYLTLAGLHGGEALKREVGRFVCGHPDVMLGEEWGQFSEKNPKLALEVHQNFVRSKTENLDLKFENLDL